MFRLTYSKHTPIRVGAMCFGHKSRKRVVHALTTLIMNLEVKETNTQLTGFNLSIQKSTAMHARFHLLEKWMHEV